MSRSDNTNRSDQYHLCVTAEADPGALARILERFQNLNLVPRRVVAEWIANDTLHVQVDIVGLSEERVSLIAAKLSQAPSVLSAYWCR
jgi:hypothetical protein